MKREDFQEPTTLDDAKARKSQVESDVRAVERQLSERRIIQSTRSGPDPNYNQWRKSAVLKAGHLRDELSFLNDWLRAYHANFQKTLVGGVEYQEVRAAAHKGLSTLLSYCDGLTAENRELAAENARLRDIIQGTQPAPVAPNEGVDEWRDDPA